MAGNDQKEILTNSRFYLEIEGLPELFVKKVSGVQVTLEAAGDQKPFGISKGAKTKMQATVSGVTSGTINVEFVAIVDDMKLHNWFRASHPIGGTMLGGASDNAGLRKAATLFVYNQGDGDNAAAEWEFTGVFPKSYKTSKMEPGSTELFTETVEFVYETCHRIK